MIFGYGAWRSQPGTCSLTINKVGIKNAIDQIAYIQERWFVRGQLLYDNPAQIKQQTERLEQAFARNYQDAVFLLPDGRTTSAHSMRNNQTMAGVRVSLPPSYPNTENAECASYRTFVLELACERIADTLESNTLSFSESLSCVGGGWKRLMQEVPNGRPIRQTVRQQTICTVIQEGNAVGLVRPPIEPQAISPEDLVDQFPEFMIRSGRFTGGGAPSFSNLEIPTSWRYVMEFDYRFTALQPNVWTS